MEYAIVMIQTNLNLALSRVVWNILRHPLMLPTMLLLMTYKVCVTSCYLRVTFVLSNSFFTVYLLPLAFIFLVIFSERYQPIIA